MPADRPPQSLRRPGYTSAPPGGKLSTAPGIVARGGGFCLYGTRWAAYNPLQSYVIGLAAPAAPGKCWIVSDIHILCIGDVVGKPGRDVLADHLPALIEARRIGLVVCNAENAAGGSGLTPEIFKKLLAAGVDVVTLGDHAYRKKQIIPTLETSDRIVRPANLAVAAAGKRWTAVPTRDGSDQAAVALVLGQMYMKPADSPWAAVERLLKEIPADVRLRIIDVHAEASSEKIAMGWNLDGRATLVFGTHTHVPTADACILPGGTAYISDVGMTGPYDGVLGRRKDRVLKSLLTDMPTFYEIATGDVRLCGVLVTADTRTGRASAIERIEIRGQARPGRPYDKDDGMGQNA
ncbi:MAG: YmdB family metallophosphoesterase [Planctomycetes bacterium]|nr:YmdB family metallophosphoesterase [Planctomycetota bacterium]